MAARSRPPVSGASGSSQNVIGKSDAGEPDPGPSRLIRARRARRINRELALLHPDAACELTFTTPLELLVATVLSAQSTDKMVNKTTPALFSRYASAAAYAAAERTDLEELLRPTGFFRAKTTSVLGLAAALVERFDGEVPGRLEDLVTLPGVGRKTANVVLGHAFGVPGVTVDTHVGRLVRRWELTAEEDPVKVEAVLNDLLPRKEWTLFSDRAIFHGRRVCHARKPACGACAIARACPSYGLGPTEPDAAAKLLKGMGADIEAIP